MLDAFNQFFEIIPAVTQEIKNEAYKLRYQVYCLEVGIADAEHCINGMESDAYDGHSAHYLIRHRVSGEYAASTRLILPDITDHNKPFQMEGYCTIDGRGMMPELDRRHLGEASRFCVSKSFKKRKYESNTVAAIGNQQNALILDHAVAERRTFPHITLALFSCLIRASHENDIHYWYALLEEPLIRFFSTLGIYFIKIGNPVDVYGERWPCIIKVSSLLDEVAKKNRDVWDMFTNKGRYWD